MNTLVNGAVTSQADDRAGAACIKRNTAGACLTMHSFNEHRLRYILDGMRHGDGLPVDCAVTYQCDAAAAGQADASRSAACRSKHLASINAGKRPDSRR